MSAQRRLPARLIGPLAGVMLAVLAGVAQPSAQRDPQRPGGSAGVASSAGREISVVHVQGNVHVLVGSTSNILVQTGPLGPVVVDSGAAADSEKVVAAIRRLTETPIRFIINTHFHSDHVDGNAALARAGAPLHRLRVNIVEDTQAEIVAHELVFSRMTTPKDGAPPLPLAAWPTSTFAGHQKEFFTNGEGLQIVHQPSAHTDGDVVVFFRRSDVIAAGDLYSTVSYPVIDTDHGGGIAGALDGLNRLLALAIPGEKNEGGTIIVPGHGRISDEADVVEYRDMVTIIRDRIADMVGRGMTLAQVKAARPTLEYDPIYGSAPGWSTDQFVEAVYKGLRANNTSRNE